LLVYFDRTRRGSIFQGSRRVLEMMFPSTSAVKPGVGCELLDIRVSGCQETVPSLESQGFACAILLDWMN
jgi:hypothetical protein